MTRWAVTVLAVALAVGCNNDSQTDNRNQSQATESIYNGPVLTTNALADLGLLVTATGSNNLVLVDAETGDPVTGWRPVVIAANGDGNVVSVVLRQPELPEIEDVGDVE